MDVLVTGASGAHRDRTATRAGRCRPSADRIGATTRCRCGRDLVGPGDGPARPRVDRGCWRCDPPRGRRHRRQAMDRGAEARAPREPRADHRAPRPRDRGAPGAAPDPRERIGDRVLRRSRRRDPRPRRAVPAKASSPSSARHGRRPPRPPSRRGRSSPTSDRESSSPRRAARWPSCCRSSGSASGGASARAASGRAGSRSTTRWPRSCTS